MAASVPGPNDPGLDATEPTARPLLEEYLKHLALERGLSPNTRKAYGSDVKQFLRHLDGAGGDPLTASQEDISEYLWVLKTKNGLEPSSLFRKIEALKSFYGFQAAERGLKANPAEPFRSPRLPARLPRALSREEMEKLRRVPAGPSFEAARLRTMLELLYATGMRVSELVSLKPEALNLEDGWVRVFGKGSKERLVPIHDGAAAILKQYLVLRRQKFKDRGGPELFLGRTGKRLSRVQFWRDLRGLGRRAGLKEPLHPHMIRHTFATHMLQGGADLRAVQELLGHASLATTQIYTHLEKSGLKASHRKHHPRG